MRKGEPKVESKTSQAFKRERQRPGAAARYFIARRRNAGRLHAPTLAAFPGSLAPVLFEEDKRIVYCRAWFDPWQRPPGWETHVDTL